MSDSDFGLRSPDSQLLKHVEALCLLDEPYNHRDYEELFNRAMREITVWHAQKNSFYARLVEDRKTDLSMEGFAWQDTPFVWAPFFKTHEILSLRREDVFLHLTSSGTSGQKSQVFFDHWSIRSAQRMVDRIFIHEGWSRENERQSSSTQTYMSTSLPASLANEAATSASREEPSDYLLYSYETEPSSKLGTSFTDNFLCKYAPIHQVCYALKLTGAGDHEFDFFGVLRFLLDSAVSGRPLRIFGFPSFFFFTLKRMQKLKIEPIRLHPDSLVFLGGGWKGYQGEEVSKKELYALATEMLGLSPDRLRDGYGSVEHCVPYVECREHEFHVPTWSRVLIRDVRTLEILPEGEIGFLQFVSPYITSMPAHSIIMGDLASLSSNCKCGRATPVMRLHGRAGLSKNKSCAIAAAELMKGQA